MKESIPRAERIGDLRGKKDLILLSDLAKYRLLTVSQITALHFGSKQLARRRLRDLVSKGLLETTTMSPDFSRGRPECAYSLSKTGVKLIQESGGDSHASSYTAIGASETARTMDHVVALNWFWIYLQQIPKNLPDLSVQFLSSISPRHRDENEKRPFVYETAPAGKGKIHLTGFTPDGVFTIHSAKHNQTLLFYLEIDQGTEPFTSREHNAGGIRQKILNYKGLFRQDRYKRYEGFWQCQLKGFRLLFVTNTPKRLRGLCKLVREMSPSDFIWLTEQDKIFNHGLADIIWTRGGNESHPFQSILSTELGKPLQLYPFKA